VRHLLSRGIGHLVSFLNSPGPWCGVPPHAARPMESDGAPTRIHSRARQGHSGTEARPATLPPLLPLISWGPVRRAARIGTGPRFKEAMMPDLPRFRLELALLLLAAAPSQTVPLQSGGFSGP
jgi:hypothetical protein